MSVFVMCRPDRSSVADAPTVAASAPLSPRIAGEDDDDARPLLAAERDREAARERRSPPPSPSAAASVRTRWVRDSSVLTPSWWQSSAWRVRSALDVAADEQDGRDQRSRRRSRRTKTSAAGERRQRVRSRGGARRSAVPPRCGRYWLIALFQLVGKREHQRRQHEEDARRTSRFRRPCSARSRRSRARRSPRASRRPRRRSPHRATPGVRERDLELRDAVEDRLAREEAHEHGGHHQHERDDRVVEQLRPEHGQPLGHRGEASSGSSRSSTPR